MSAGVAPSQVLLRFLVAVVSTVVLVLVARDRETFYQLAAGRLVFTQIKSSYIPGLV
jgi:membrane-anchored protein YejM (alkaline phosphatase superfamily)